MKLFETPWLKKVPYEYRFGRIRVCVSYTQEVFSIRGVKEIKLIFYSHDAEDRAKLYYYNDTRQCDGFPIGILPPLNYQIDRAIRKHKIIYVECWYR